MIYPLHARHSAGKLENDVNIWAAKALIGRLNFIDLGFGTSELSISGPSGLASLTQHEGNRNVRRLSIDRVADER